MVTRIHCWTVRGDTQTLGVYAGCYNDAEIISGMRGEDPTIRYVKTLVREVPGNMSKANVTKLHQAWMERLAAA